MKNLTWQNPEQLFVAQELINKVKSKCCGIKDYHKIVRTQTVVDQGVDLYNLDVVNDSGFDSPDGAYQIKEITKAINSLNDELKIPFSMFLSGYKYNEIAEKLCVPLGTVKSRIFFARQELQKVLKDFHRS